MGLFQPSNVHEESWFLLFVIKLVGLYPVRFHTSQYTNYIYAAVLLFLYYSLFGNINDYARQLIDTIGSITTVTKIRQARHYMNVVLLPLILISTTYRSGMIRSVFEQINNVDKNAKFLNIEIDYTWCMKNDIVRLTTVIFVTIIFNLMDYYALLDNNRNYKYVLMWIADRIPDFIDTIVMCSFAALMNKIEFRFQRINEILNNITEGKTLFSISQSSDVQNNYRLRLSRMLQQKLCKTMSLLHEAYGFQFKILTMMYIVYVCLHMCVVYIASNIKMYAVDVILSTLWGSLDIVKLVYIIHLYRTLTIQYI